MSDFVQFKTAVQKQFERMVKDGVHLFKTDVDKDTIWNMYLDSFPEGTNEIYKERREFDCQCCKSFIRKMGNVVAIIDNKLVSIWDIEVEHPFDVVAATLAHLVKTYPIRDAFFSKEAFAGVDYNEQYIEGKDVITWQHFYLQLPISVSPRDRMSVAEMMGKVRDSKNVFKRSLDELTTDAAQTVIELIDQGSLYRGEEFKNGVIEFLRAKTFYDNIPEQLQDNWCWQTSRGSAVSRIRNTAIGTLLIDLSAGMELDEAVRKFEAVVAPTNYKRPKAIFTKHMVEAAQTKILDLGYADSLARRHASLDDIRVNNVLFINRFARDKGMTVFDELAEEVPISQKNFSKLEEVSIEKFITQIMPNTTSIKLAVEAAHKSNLVTLIAPGDQDAPSIFKWNNGFSWSYAGDVADSMKQRVKAAGGKVDGVLRFSIQWNDGDNNQNDFDAHCQEPAGNHIYYGNKYNSHTGGDLDVDIINPGSNVAVENITWVNKERMDEGVYKFWVHNYSHQGGTTGFTAEIEFNGEIYSYSYDKELNPNERVEVATLTFSKTDGIAFVKSMDSTRTQQELWGIKTNSFIEVASIMRSPNYWDEQDGSGNEHYFFFLNGCVNDTNPRGFYNEFLKQDLLAHKQVFEALGSKMRVAYAQDQLSGVGFSTTQRNSVVARVEGAFSRTIRITF